MDVREIVKKINGKDEKNKANAAITLQSVMVHVDGNVKETGVTTCHKPEIVIEKRGKYVQVDLKFMSALDEDLKKLWGMLEVYGNKVTEVTKQSVEIPVTSLTMVPLERECKYYAVASNPIFWTLQPQKPGYEANMIRLLFENVNLKFYETEYVDLHKIDEELLREE